jgi:hypothetical protein
MAHPKIFVSYSHADTKQKERLLKHLGAPDDAAEFDVWTDAQIRPGEKWEPAIEQALSNASVAILLISADFLVSDFVRHKEIPAILERREKDDLRLYPILAKPCAWQAIPWIKEIQIRPAAAKPVWRSGGRYADDELAKIVLELLAIIDLVIQVQKAADETARQKAEQEKREKEKEIAAIIASSPAVESFYLPLRVEAPGGVETTILDQHTLTADELGRRRSTPRSQPTAPSNSKFAGRCCRTCRPRFLMSPKTYKCRASRRRMTRSRAGINTYKNSKAFLTTACARHEFRGLNQSAANDSVNDSLQNVDCCGRFIGAEAPPASIGASLTNGTFPHE